MDNQIVNQTKAFIRNIRGQGVILAVDVAKIYGESTKRINERVRRHPGKFPTDFMFQLTKQEFEELRSQIATSKPKRGGTQYLPYAFTEHGVLQIANLINTSLAEGKMSPSMTAIHGELLPKLQSTIGRILESVVDSDSGATVKDEALEILKESISHLKEKLRLVLEAQIIMTSDENPKERQKLQELIEVLKDVATKY